MVNIITLLSEVAKQNGLIPDALQLPDCEISPESVQVVMVSEVPPRDPQDGFYSKAPVSDYMKSTLGLFEMAGVPVQSMGDILGLGIYITTAVKSPKSGYTVDADVLNSHLPLLEAELALFPNLKAIMAMGDVSIKAVNKIVKARTKKNVIPSQSTYKIRNNEYFWGSVRVFPSYIITGKNLLIEKGKCDMIAEDIRRMMELLQG